MPNGRPGIASSFGGTDSPHCSAKKSGPVTGACLSALRGASADLDAGVAQHRVHAARGRHFEVVTMAVNFQLSETLAWVSVGQPARRCKPTPRSVHRCCYESFPICRSFATCLPAWSPSASAVSGCETDGLVQLKVTLQEHEPEAPARISRSLAGASGSCSGRCDSAKRYPAHCRVEPCQTDRRAGRSRPIHVRQITRPPTPPRRTSGPSARFLRPVAGESKRGDDGSTPRDSTRRWRSGAGG